MHPDMPARSPILSLMERHRSGERVGICSVCCSNDHALLAAMDAAREYDSVLLIESTSNQVDQFGGYSGRTPAQFRDHVRELARQENFPPERLVLGGDHLGPNAWQHLPAAQAMEFSRELIAAYASAGFHKIHLDCSMSCADDPVRLPDETVAARAVELCAIAERAAAAAGLPPPVYVIGTEVPVPGGEASLDAGLQVTSPAAAARTLDVHREAFAATGLDDAWTRVIAMVVQPGVDFDHSHVHDYAPEAATGLSAFVESQPRIVFEAHSTDYQTEGALHALVRDHFAILKVGPAATFAMREAIFALAAIEDELVPGDQRSRVVETLERCMLENPKHWQKHYAGNENRQRLLRKYALSDRSRYYWGEPPLRDALRKLIANLDAIDIPPPLLSQFLPEAHAAVRTGKLQNRPEALIRHRIAGVLSQYARACSHNHAS